MSYKENFVSRQSSTDESPFKLLYSRLARLPSDLDCGNNCNLVIDLKMAWEEAKRKLIECAAKEKQRHDATDKITFKIGDRVRVFMPACKVGLVQKLRADKWHGPFVVEQVLRSNNVVVRLGDNKVYKVHTDRVKHAETSRLAMYSTVTRTRDHAGMTVPSRSRVATPGPTLRKIEVEETTTVGNSSKKLVGELKKVKELKRLEEVKKVDRSVGPEAKEEREYQRRPYGKSRYGRVLFRTDRFRPDQ